MSSPAQKPHRYKAKLVDKKWLSNTVFFCAFEINAPVRFEAGQFMMFDFSGIDGLPNGEKPRAYSISNAPIPIVDATKEKTGVLAQNTRFEFIIKFYESGKTVNLLKDKEPGKFEMQINGPFGQMVSAESPPLMLIATGVGIAPFISMIYDQLENKKNKNKIHLFWGTRFSEDLFCADKLEKMAKKFQNFTFIPTLSRPHKNWSGSKGYVSESVKIYLSKMLSEKKQNPALQTHFYICGNPEMVKDVKNLLETNKVQKEKVHFEVW